MKQHFFSTATIICAALFSLNSLAQKTPPEVKKSEEIIIKRNDDKTTKMTIEIDGDSVLVNGKPLSEYHDGDVTISQRNLTNRDFRNSMFLPENNRDFEVFTKDFADAKPKAFLGVMMSSTANGVKLTEVVKSSAAEKAGLQKGDIITKINDTKIATPDELTQAVSAHKPGDDVKVYYNRDKQNKETKVKLGTTKNHAETFSYNSDADDMNNNNEFDFKMPPMPHMNSMNRLYNLRLDNNNRPRLGLKIEDTENNEGVKVIAVEEGSAADKAGIKKDDIITSVNDEKVSNVDEMRDETDNADDKEADNANDKKNMQLKALRNGTEINFEIIIPKKMNSADL